ncbi:uncharacterized protein HaLaN_15040 [Haematococcus lacustris]|uniref:Uncharacterized protein n=1 Tax=Haematococcus lacustris TaxID=44745 RepID=A0A699Z6L9_HAELA|nr:uncharacterized protein HaLaN_15040 [Haematococcus lacustris]
MKVTLLRANTKSAQHFSKVQAKQCRVRASATQVNYSIQAFEDDSFRPIGLPRKNATYTALMVVSWSDAGGLSTQNSSRACLFPHTARFTRDGTTREDRLPNFLNGRDAQANELPPHYDGSVNTNTHTTVTDRLPSTKAVQELSASVEKSLWSLPSMKSTRDKTVTVRSYLANDPRFELVKDPYPEPLGPGQYEVENGVPGIGPLPFGQPSRTTSPGRDPGRHSAAFVSPARPPLFSAADSPDRVYVGPDALPLNDKGVAWHLAKDQRAPVADYRYATRLNDARREVSHWHTSPSTPRRGLCPFAMTPVLLPPAQGWGRAWLGSLPPASLPPSSPPPPCPVACLAGLVTSWHGLLVANHPNWPPSLSSPTPTLRNLLTLLTWVLAASGAGRHQHQQPSAQCCQQANPSGGPGPPPCSLQGSIYQQGDYMVPQKRWALWGLLAVPPPGPAQLEEATAQWEWAPRPCSSMRWAPPPPPSPTHPEGRCMGRTHGPLTAA